MIDVFGTLGPGCDNEEILFHMFQEGMTGIRINLSHVKLLDCKESLERIKSAAEKNGIIPKILMDMQGPELRIGNLAHPIILKTNDEVLLGEGGIYVEEKLISKLNPGTEVLLDDGKILLQITKSSFNSAKAIVLRGGKLSSRKRIMVKDTTIDLPALSSVDMENLSVAKDLGITGIMQPFVRSRSDLMEVRNTFSKYSCHNFKIYAKIENRRGLREMENFFDLCDEIVIARGDLGNCMPLWELPKVQKEISSFCNEHHKSFMVVTQMLASMENCSVPTRAEVSDIYNAALDGAASVMVTGETAVGKYPVEVIRYLKQTVDQIDK